ncbi:MAG: hypothetical protein JWM35_544, partial [Verrucomicrobia bacterium]|nr:hypothetical protein [Verrucomicrobiota bacterium]
MNFVSRLLWKMRALIWKQETDAEMTEEMRVHLEMQARENLATGMSADEARHAAHRAFGHIEGIKEHCRDQRRWAWVEHVAQDFRIGFRSLRKYPAFSVITILTLALGIGANTAIFSVVNAALLRPLAVNRADELVVLTKAGAEQYTDLSYPTYRYLRDHAQTVSGLAAAYPGVRALDKPSDTDSKNPPTRTSEVSGNYFSVLGVQATLGRVLTPLDDRDGAAENVAVISDRIWRARFGADASVVGQTVLIDRVPCTIVGVAPASFHGLSASEPVDMWLPIQLGPRLDAIPPQARLMHEVMSNTSVIGRLAAGTTRAQAAAELGTLFQTRQEELASVTFKNWPAAMRQRFFSAKLDVRSGFAGNNVRFVTAVRPLVSVLWIVVALVLLLASANVASLL